MSSINPSMSSGSCGGGSSSGGGSGSGSSSCGGGGPCGACKFLRRKCVVGCIFAPYFDSEQGAAHFAAVHKVFGASNVSKMLLHIPVHKRLDAVVTICFEAQARLRDPVYGCVAHIFALQQQVVNLQAELNYLQSHLATLELPNPPPQVQQPILLAQPLSISDLPTTTTNISTPTYDLSSLFDPLSQQQQASWAAMHPWQMDLRGHFGGAASRPPETSSSSGGGIGNGTGDLQELARALLQRRDGNVTVASTPLLPHSQ